ncbi:hypothetical protein [Luteibacter sp. 22Crub2.1]|nr:hypothetical protein [Luteibacter sp. 22Crub2.1]SKB27868.1 hypothetical protein SAMN05660880_00297 [Luteibacter sp. 22Crub2.1]
MPGSRIREARYQVTPYTTSVDGYGKTLYQYDTVYVCPAKQAAG